MMSNVVHNKYITIIWLAAVLLLQIEKNQILKLIFHYLKQPLFLKGTCMQNFNKINPSYHGHTLLDICSTIPN